MSTTPFATARICRSALSHGGTLVASARAQEDVRGEQEPVHVWDAATGHELYRLRRITGRK